MRQLAGEELVGAVEPRRDGAVGHAEGLRHLVVSQVIEESQLHGDSQLGRKPAEGRCDVGVQLGGFDRRDRGVQT